MQSSLSLFGREGQEQTSTGKGQKRGRGVWDSQHPGDSGPGVPQKPPQCPGLPPTPARTSELDQVIQNRPHAQTSHTATTLTTQSCCSTSTAGRSAASSGGLWWTHHPGQVSPGVPQANMGVSTLCSGCACLDVGPARPSTENKIQHYTHHKTSFICSNWTNLSSKQLSYITEPKC